MRVRDSLRYLRDGEGCKWDERVREMNVRKDCENLGMMKGIL